MSRSLAVASIPMWHLGLFVKKQFMRHAQVFGSCQYSNMAPWPLYRKAVYETYPGLWQLPVFRSGTLASISLSSFRTCQGLGHLPAFHLDTTRQGMSESEHSMYVLPNREFILDVYSYFPTLEHNHHSFTQS